MWSHRTWMAEFNDNVDSVSLDVTCFAFEFIAHRSRDSVTLFKLLHVMQV